MVYGESGFFTQKHYEKSRGMAPAPLCELVVHCLELVSQLSASGLRYRFKGGNSLLILLENPQRFSIDVDIATTESKEKLIQIMEDIAKNCSAFTRVDVRQHKTKPWLPMISFHLYFPSVYGGEANVMLDAVLEPPPYPGITKKVRCGKLYHSDQQVEVPGIDGLTADKFLTLGPATLGIPLNKGKAAQRLKHVFDVALLLRQNPDTAKIREYISGCMEQENALQKSSHKLDAVIKDTEDFLSSGSGFVNAEAALAASSGNDYLKETAEGFSAFREHLFGREYSWKDLQEDCSVILQLCSALKE